RPGGIPHERLSRRDPLSPRARPRHARRLGAVAARQDARVGSGARFPVGGGPELDIPWGELHPERSPEAQIMAARLHWSRRTWGEYGAISESPALLLRFCLENRHPDLRFFFTMRTQEEGRHAEASWLMAERLGGYFPQPQNPPTVDAVGTHGVRRMAFDPEPSLEGISASLVCAAEEILIDAFKATVHKATNPAVRRLMELILRDEVRHI